MPVAGRTALRTVTLGVNLLGRRVLVTGAAGGLGRLQTQLAVLSGADVVAVTRRTGSHQALHAMGARVIVEQAADAEGLFDLVLDSVGGGHLVGSVSKVAPGGSIVLTRASDPEPATLSLLDFVGHENASIHAYFSYAQPGSVASDLAELVRLIAGGRLTPAVGLHRSWADTNRALGALAEGKVDGKAVLDVR